jgi:hypothetical protein
MTPDAPRVVPAKRGFSVFYEGRPLLSTIDPAAACQRLIAALPKDERTLYLCVSPLLGLGLPRLLDTMHPTSALLCLEADNSLADFTRDHLPPEITRHPHFALLADPPPGTNPAAALALMTRAWGRRAFRRVVRFNLSAATALHAPCYLNIEDTLRREITLEWENAATLMKLGRRYALNFLRNLRLLDTVPSVETYSDLAESYKGRKSWQLTLPTPRPSPAWIATWSFAEQSSRRKSTKRIYDPLYGGSAPGTPSLGLPSNCRKAAIAPIHVLGAGPSLDRFFADYHGGSIVCVDTALPALRSHGLRAGLAVALEAQHWNLRDFVGCSGTVAALAMDMSALPATLDCINGKVYLFFTPWTPLCIFDRLRKANLLPLEMPPLGNVGITAYSLTRRLFPAAEVIPHGLDFAFTIDQYHCRDSPGHIDTLRKLDRFHSPFPAAALRSAAFNVINERGEPVRQDPVMRRYKELFQTLQHQNIPAGDTGVEFCHRQNSGRDCRVAAIPPHTHQKTAVTFAREIHAELTRIRRILTGEEKASGEYLQTLLNNNDFLFAHYPDYAGTGNRANIEDLSFLKRIRAETDAFIKAVSAV